MKRNKKKKEVKGTDVLTMTVNGTPTPFGKVQFFQNLNVEYDPVIDVYKGEIKLWPAPIAYPTSEFHEDGTLKLPYGTEVDFHFGKDATIRGKVLNLRGKLRLIEVGMKVGDILHETKPPRHEPIDVNKGKDEIEDFAKTLEVVEGIV